ncbi:hypothetical protein CH379_009585 [Leptospira ellisii]|uniref:Amidohydrolase-related domain-containing protein n=1 Tax=Leptospira ellisii TaxID=2023197 RepID=A0AAE4QNJ9_9LEPT|nr:hypothetical protein [Leptospira ellisii]MDV6235875.1 hypothetical protein [Leptospira ellisii]
MNIPESVLFVKRVIFRKGKKKHLSEFEFLRFVFKPFAFSFILLFTFASLRSENSVLNGVRYLLPGKKEYSDVSEIRIENGRIVSIKKTNSYSGKISFALPGFCDANVTLSADSLGGQKDRAGVYLSLQSFLAHGFSSVFSVGDPTWVGTLWKDAQKAGKYSPWIKKSSPPWIAESSETKNLGTLPGYQVIRSSQDALSKIKKGSDSPLHLFSRFQEGETFVFDGPFLYQLKKAADGAGIALALSAFGDEFSILEGINAGVPTLFHPIPDSISGRVAPGIFRNLNWGPMLSVYFYQKIAGTPEWETDLTGLKDWSSYFSKNIAPEPEFAGKLSNLKEEERKNADAEFKSYLAFLKKQRNLSQGILLASGTGYLHVHPGIGGWKEMELLASVLGNEETIRIATESTCSFLEAPHEGKIREGKPAFINVFTEDPLVDLKNLKSLRKVIVGEISYPSEKREPTSSPKKRGKR